MSFGRKFRRWLRIWGVSTGCVLAPIRGNDLLDDVQPTVASDFWSGRVEVNFGDRTTPIDLFTFWLRGERGQHAGSVTITR